ncbi:MAG TPA: (2Fe-2S) ferredoxin domain-containing protein [Candidatus Bathyarchaeia archaeon]|nr:(2Fe-2S) ferredoxin domain-containing protein [Candidatus Bathyarchaeia archaeon]
MTPYKLHILVCNDTDCADKGSQQLYDNLKQMVKDRNLKGTIKVSKSTCLDDCEIGPNVLVYPNGVLYNSVKTDNLETILEAHIKGKSAVKLKHHKMLK